MIHFSFCLENIRSAYNVGSIFRIADAFGARHLYTMKFTPGPAHHKVAKTALGSQYTVNHSYHPDPIQIISSLKKKSQVISLETVPSAINIFSLNFSHNTCFILGNELSGISPELISLSDLTVSIPMVGTKDSLNVASAAAIAAYEFFRQQQLT